MSIHACGWKHDGHCRKRNARPAGGAAALFRHARYVIGENPITGLAFGLFLLIVIAAMVGPWIVPYNPLASDTARR